MHVQQMSLHVAAIDLQCALPSHHPRQPESVVKNQPALPVHPVATAVPFGMQDAVVIQLPSFAVTVRQTGHLGQQFHHNATMVLIVVELIELTAQSQLNSGIAARHGLDNHPQDHVIQAASRDLTATRLHSPSVHKPAVTSTGDALHFQPAGLTGMNVRGRHALPSLTAQEHHAPRIAG